MGILRGWKLALWDPARMGINITGIPWEWKKYLYDSHVYEVKYEKLYVSDSYVGTIAYKMQCASNSSVVCICLKEVLNKTGMLLC